MQCSMGTHVTMAGIIQSDGSLVAEGKGVGLLDSAGDRCKPTGNLRV